MVTYVNHKFVAVADGGRGLRLFTFVMRPDVKRFVISNCSAAAAVAKKHGVLVRTPDASDIFGLASAGKRKKRRKRKTKKEIIEAGHTGSGG